MVHKNPKIQNLEKNTEFQLQVIKTGLSFTFYCSKMLNLLSDYFRAIDLYIIHKVVDPQERESYRSNNFLKKVKTSGNVIDSFEKHIRMTEVAMLYNNAIHKEHYQVPIYFIQVSFYVLRGGVRVSLLNTDNSCGSKKFENLFSS